MLHNQIVDPLTRCAICSNVLLIFINLKLKILRCSGSFKTHFDDMYSPLLLFELYQSLVF